MIRKDVIPPLSVYHIEGELLEPKSPTDQSGTGFGCLEHPQAGRMSHNYSEKSSLSVVLYFFKSPNHCQTFNFSNRIVFSAGLNRKSGRGGEITKTLP